MKKAIANLSFSDLKVRYFTGRSILISDTGQGKRYQYRNGCMTALGDLEISEWREMITELIAYRSEQELQKQLYEWCAEHTPWLHGKSEITDYALECHAARLFDDPLWADYIPFNRKYRPNVLDSAELIWAKTACCGTAHGIFGNFQLYNALMTAGFGPCLFPADKSADFRAGNGIK